MTKQLELRFSEGTIEARSTESGAMVLEGRAITYNTPSKILGGSFTEIIQRGAVNFAETIDMTIDHKDDQLVGRTGVNLTLEDREDGVWYRVELPDTTIAKDLYAMAKSGLAVANSFEFYCNAEEYKSGGSEDYDLRTVTDLTLVKVNPLAMTNPAYDASKIAEPRSYTEFKEAKPSENRTEDTEPTNIPKQETQVEVPTVEIRKEQTTMDKKELLENRAELITKLEGADSAEQMKELQTEVRSIDEKIELIEETKKLALRNFEQTNLTEKNPIMENKLNFRDLKGSTKIDLNAPEVRAVVSGDTVAGAGQVVKPLIQELRPDNLFDKLGAKVTYNNYDTILPMANKMTGSFEFKGENIKAPVAGYTLTKKTLTPKRLPITIEVSNRALMSDAVGIEGDIMRQAIAELYEVVEVKAMSADAATTEAPAGLLALATTKDIAAAGVSDAMLADSEYALEDVGVKEVKMVTTGLIKSDLRATAVDAGSGVMLYDPKAKDARGIELATSAYLKDGSAAKDCALFGDFSQLHVNFFGNTAVKKDDVTKFDEGITRFMFEFNVDWALAHPAALLFLSNIKA